MGIEWISAGTYVRRLYKASVLEETMITITPSKERDEVASRLFEDLIGPRSQEERLTAKPTDIYATGILWPQNALIEPEDNDGLGAEMEESSDSGSPIDESEAVSAVALRKPSVAGISFSVQCASSTPTVRANVQFGMYSLEDPAAGSTNPQWVRRQFALIHELPLSPGDFELQLQSDGLPNGIKLHVKSISVGTLTLATITLVNASTPDLNRASIEASTLFQTKIEIVAVGDTRLVRRPARRASVDAEDTSMDLLYRNAHEYATGHTCSADWFQEEGTHEVLSVSTSWLPTVIVPAVNPQGHPLFQKLAKTSDVFVAHWLATAPASQLTDALRLFVSTYREWINLQTLECSSLAPTFQNSAAKNLAKCEEVASRMESAISRMAVDSDFTRSFQLANKAMLLQYSWDEEKSSKGPLKWRPFQLGFLLLSAESTVDPQNPAREVMDLLWFPTGGGKTEAYLALIALAAFYHRIKLPDEAASVVAIMRYTLRLLTTQQFMRAAALIFSCELLRRTNPDLGQTPFSIGLWVGGDASPNKRIESYASLHGNGGASPKQLEKCPACGGKLRWKQVSDNTEVQVFCDGSSCQLNQPNTPLPIWTVDEDIYQFRPTLLIGTVDKFAQIVRNPKVHPLLGVADCRPPSLIIQDELHLISGPLGTVTALYETALDLIITSCGARPKIVGSTATIRRAAEHVRSLFDRELCQFPPPALDHGDSAFAVVDESAPGRKYVGITSAGRSAKFTLQAVAASLLQSGEIGLSSSLRYDPYWTLVTYFNSLRELGGSLVLMQDDVNDTLKNLSRIHGEPSRQVTNIQELTSRRTQDDVRDMLSFLTTPSGQQGAVDVVLATNMLSVGVDIPRLGLMLVYGQPKGIAEYIQATSRVGRGSVAGLVVSVLNNAKARDRSHFETFRTWHSTLYRDVEATSVTPFASRARDRALHAVFVAVVRHLIPSMLNDPKFDSVSEAKALQLISLVAERAGRVDPGEKAVKKELIDRLNAWKFRDPKFYWHEFKPRESLLQSAERAASDVAMGRMAGAAWPTMNNMRSVEVSTPFRLTEALRARGGTKSEQE